MYYRNPISRAEIDKIINQKIEEVGEKFTESFEVFKKFKFSDIDFQRAEDDSNSIFTFESGEVSRFPAPFNDIDKYDHNNFILIGHEFQNFGNLNGAPEPVMGYQRVHANIWADGNERSNIINITGLRLWLPEIDFDTEQGKVWLNGFEITNTDLEFKFNILYRKDP